MPRRTYDRSKGRARIALGLSRSTLHQLEVEIQALSRRRTQPVGAVNTAAVNHRSDCRGSSVTTFQGSRGDLMARCHSCGALAPVRTNEEQPA